MTFWRKLLYGLLATISVALSFVGVITMVVTEACSHGCDMLDVWLEALKVTSTR